MNILNKLSIRKRIILIVFLLIASVSLFDYILFDKLYYLFPNELEWDTSHWYNFEHKRKTLTNFKDNEKSVFITGSSVALYSALPKKMEMDLNANSSDIYKVKFYSHVAMSPGDLNYYLDSMISKNPKMVMYITHPGDFQLDYFDIAYDPTLKVEKILEISETRRIKDYASRYPAKLFYPFTYILEHGIGEIGKEDFFSLLTKAILNINRTRLFFWDPINAYYERHFRNGRSYHNYTGKIPLEGVWRKGWAPPKFTIDCELTNGKLDETIFIEIPDTTITIKENDKEIYKGIFASGWKDLELDFGDKQEVKLSFEVDKVVSSKQIDPKSYAKVYEYGIRFPQNFCRRNLEKNIAYDRRESLDDTSFFDMTENEYKEDYYNRLFKDLDIRPELRRLRLIRNIKNGISEREFKPWSEFLALKEIADKLKSKGIKFVIINNTENPLEIGVYGSEKWLNGYKDYLKNLSDGKTIFYFDKSRSIKDARYFIDEHHLSTVGAALMSKEYVEIIRDLLK
jgi:hypothetical protein